MKRIVILYSGGVDSTAASVMMAKQFDQIHLLSFTRLGLFNIERINLNVRLLEAKFGRDKFCHVIININKLFKMISYARYFQGLRKYGFFLLSTCGLCKLSMHIRTLIYCLDNGIHFVADGANKNMSYFPDQTTEYINEVKDLYARFKINYLNPVYDFDCPERDIDWMHKLRNNIYDASENDSLTKKNTTSQFLLDEGILNIPNAKAEKINQNTQARCFQLVLYNIFLYWYFLPTYGDKKYKQFIYDFYKERIQRLSNMLADYQNERGRSLLHRYLE
ncbi:MAG: hypothetical protein PHT50_01555 [Candidatus Omnitrophica bacterium]|nr:hypothetical protein [Candidatus Omnitrophota bacterium]